ncbi:MAG: alpha/beta hydrolase [Polyangiaceae bacterium]|nr:alpha/beta hydrolase [Polyangiaceae bacterium]
MSDGDFFHSTISVGEISLHVVETRPKGVGSTHKVPGDIPLVVFLHGFPEYWRSWRHQLEAFAKAGFWAVAPDMRGYGESDKPKGVVAYEVEHLAADIAGLIRALDREDAIVVGHDWGAIVAWYVAQLHPERVERLAILNVPHPLQMMNGLRTLRQLAKSSYAFFFQLPAIPERAVQFYNFFFLRKMFEVDGMGADDINHIIGALRTPHVLTSAMNYYRAIVRRVASGRLPPTRRIEAPVLVIWGDADRYLGKELATPPAQFVPNARVVHIPGASHWVQNVACARVNELLLAFARETCDHTAEIAANRKV